MFICAESLLTGHLLRPWSEQDYRIKEISLYFQIRFCWVGWTQLFQPESNTGKTIPNKVFGLNRIRSCLCTLRSVRVPWLGKWKQWSDQCILCIVSVFKLLCAILTQPPLPISRKHSSGFEAAPSPSVNLCHSFDCKPELMLNVFAWTKSHFLSRKTLKTTLLSETMPLWNRIL